MMRSYQTSGFYYIPIFGKEVNNSKFKLFSLLAVHFFCHKDRTIIKNCNMYCMDFDNLINPAYI